jgi:hypothetical protein
MIAQAVDLPWLWWLDLIKTLEDPLGDCSTFGTRTFWSAEEEAAAIFRRSMNDRPNQGRQQVVDVVRAPP